jgi:hypothetical protein
MSLKLSHKEWVSALEQNQLSVFDIVEYANQSGAKFMWHPLGFVFCKTSEEENKKIRIHIWPNNNDRMQNPSWLIHDHLFDLKSWVISGEIENTEYSIIDGIPNCKFYDATYEGSKSILSETSRSVCIKTRSIELVKSGEIYRVPYGRLHKSISLSNLTSFTVCETIDKLNTPPRIVGEIDGHERYTYERSLVQENDLIDLLDKI